jgi:hypothetical protein
VEAEKKVNRLKQENQKGQFRRRIKKGTALDERDPRQINVASLLFSPVPLSSVKVEQTGGKDARTSQEAYLMPPQTSFYKKCNLWRP